MKYRRPCLALILCPLAGLACTGSIGLPSGSPESESAPEGDPFVPEDPATSPFAPEEHDLCVGLLRAGPVAPLTPSMRRLSWSEIHNSLTDLFPEVAPDTFRDLLPEDRSPGREAPLLQANETFVRSYRPALAAHARKVAAAVATRACPNGDASCLQQWVRQTARLAWRGSFGAAEASFLDERIQAFRSELSAAETAAAGLELVLASPRFLYLLEPGSASDDSGAGRARGATLAGLLAATLWASVPDAALLNAADEGRLDDGAGLSDEVDRMLADPRARRGVMDFFRAWLGHNRVLKAIKDDQRFAGFDDAVRAEMLSDTESTLAMLVFELDASASELVTSPLSRPGRRTASLLGWGDVPDEPVSLAHAGRHGIATHPAILAAYSGPTETSIVKRGQFFVEHLSCGHVPPPPPGVDDNIDEILANAGRPLTNREIAERHANEPACASCHQYLDPFGIAFESYDAIGRRRSEIQGQPIDTAITINGDFLGLGGDYADSAALLDRLAATHTPQRCFVGQLAHFVRPAELTQAQACALAALTRSDAGRAPSMRELVRRFVTSDLFLTRAL